MVVTTVYSPDITTYAARSPYITRDEFREAGTGADWKQMVPGRASLADQEAALDRAIARASSWADTFCRKVLGATADTTAGTFRVQPDRTLAVPLPYTPVVAVTGVSVGLTGYAATSMADLSSVWIDGNIVRIGAWSDNGSAVLASAPGARAGYRYVTVTYVNGWANTTLAAPSSAGDVVVTVASPLGLFPGMTLTLDDGGNSEQVTVDAAYVPGGASVPLAAPLANDHDQGVSATMLPQAIKQAVILYTASLIRTRGSSAIVMGQTGTQPEQTTSSLPGGSREQSLAEQLLMPFRRTW